MEIIDDDELNRRFFEAMGEPESVNEDPLVNARALAEREQVECPFSSSDEVFARLSSVSKNSQAVLRASLGLSGSIEWATLPMDWTDPAQMDRRLGHECLWVPTVLGSYSHEVVDGFHAVRAVSPRAYFFEQDVQRFISEHDPALPLVVQASFEGRKNPQYDDFLAEMQELVERRMQWRGPFSISMEGRMFTVQLPLMDSRGTVQTDVPYQYYEELFTHLEETGKGERGGLRFSKNVTIHSPRLEKERGLARGPVQINRCTLGAPRKLPSNSAVASFFDLSSPQVEAVVRGFYCPAQPLHVPQRTRLERAVSAK